MTSNTKTKNFIDDKPDFCTLRGRAMYAKVFEPSAYNEQYNIPARWEIDILLPRAEALKAEERGLNIRRDNAKFRQFCEDQGLVAQGYDGAFIKIKKPTVKKKWDANLGQAVKDSTGQVVTEAAPRPRVVDSNGTEIPESSGLLIGNGSEVEVNFIITKPQVGGREQFGKFGGRLIETKIMTLVEYKRPEGSFTYEESSSHNTVGETKPSTSNNLRVDEIPFLPDED